MREYKIAATVRHSRRYIEHELAAMNIPDAGELFGQWLAFENGTRLQALSELDITETGESE
jgi:hypothetical protein